MGAWIETYSKLIRETIIMSHPTWVRGLKLEYVKVLHPASSVAPYVGAWIETAKSVVGQ